MGYSFLLVDDSAIVRRAVNRALCAAGIEIDKVYEAASGREGLTVLESGVHVDLVFLDMNMPIMNGLEFLQAVRGNQSFGELPVILLSAEGSKERLAQFEELGVVGQLRKPVFPEMIADLVGRALPGGGV